MPDQVRNILSGLWKKACEADGIEPDAKFVVFSEDNKYARLYNSFALQVFGEPPQTMMN